MPQREDDNKMLIINMIYEKQIKKIIKVLYWPRFDVF